MASSIVLDRGLFGKQTNVEIMFQRSQILDELIPPAHIESSVTFSSKICTNLRFSGESSLSSCRPLV
jgi:hypothetical protein